ncbi:hypothetical protein HKD37_14G040613 [Glycine soja]
MVGNINILIVQYTSMFVLNNALKGFDDTPQSKSKATAKLIVVKGKGRIKRKYLGKGEGRHKRIQANFHLQKNKYFNDARPLELERLKVLRIQWANYYLKVNLGLLKK